MTSSDSAATSANRYVVLYQPDPSQFEKAGELFSAHVAHYTAAAAEGELLSFGPFADLLSHGSMGVFSSQRAAEAFVSQDPFVVGGVVAHHEIRPWTDSIA